MTKVKTPACPVCGEPVDAGLPECPNCGAALAVEASALPELPRCPHCQAECAPEARFCPACGKPLQEADAAAPKESAAEAALAARAVRGAAEQARAQPESRPKGSKASPRVSRPARQVDPPPRRASSPKKQANYPGAGTPADPAGEQVCPVCGYAFRGAEQQRCMGCEVFIYPSDAQAQGQAVREQVEAFVSAFDREQGLEPPVLAYLYRKQVKPALLELHDALAAVWKQHMAQGSIIIPGREYPELLAEEAFLADSRAALTLARLWASEAVQRYVVLPEARVEVEAYLLDLMARAYQCLGRYHSARAARAETQADMQKVYEKAQWCCLQAQALNPQIDPEVAALTAAGVELARLALSYPLRYTRLKGQKNPIPVRMESDHAAYQEYLGAYDNLRERLQAALSQAHEASERFGLLQASLETQRQVLEREEAQAREHFEQERQAAREAHGRATAILPEARRGAVNAAIWTPLGAACLVVFIMSASQAEILQELPWVNWALGAGSVFAGYLHGYSRNMFHGQVPDWLNALKWLAIMAMLAGLLPLFGDWLAMMF